MNTLTVFNVHLISHQLLVFSSGILSLLNVCRSISPEYVI